MSHSYLNAIRDLDIRLSKLFLAGPTDTSEIRKRTFRMQHNGEDIPIVMHNKQYTIFNREELKVDVYDDNKCDVYVGGILFLKLEVIQCNDSDGKIMQSIPKLIDTKRKNTYIFLRNNKEVPITLKTCDSDYSSNGETWLTCNKPVAGCGLICH